MWNLSSDRFYRKIRYYQESLSDLLYGQSFFARSGSLGTPSFLSGLSKFSRFSFFSGSSEFSGRDRFAEKILIRRLISALRFTDEASGRGWRTVKDYRLTAEEFLAGLPEIRSLLEDDVEAVLDSDPAAKSRDEVILTYPGLYALCVHRYSHRLYQKNIPLLPRLLSEYAHSRTAIDIHPGASLGRRIFIDHGTGAVVGETAVLKDDVKLYQGVTIGGLHRENVSSGLRSFAERGEPGRKTEENPRPLKKRHPTIEEGVILYANSTILGGKTVVGRKSVIGAGVFLTESVEPFSFVYGLHKVKIKRLGEKTDRVDYYVI